MLTKILNRELVKIPALLKDALIVVFISLLIGILGQVAIPLPFTPVPLVTRNILILFSAVVLGPRRAALATFLFLVQGVCGLPVFSGKAAGIMALAGPLGGYLFGYLVAAYVTGAIAERKKTMGNAFLAILAGSLVIYLCGAGYLATMMGLKKAIVAGVLPFLIGDALKIAICLQVLQWMGWKKNPS